MQTLQAYVKMSIISVRTEYLRATGAYKHIDGQDKPKDHIYGEGAIILANSIAEMMAEQACLQTP